MNNQNLGKDIWMVAKIVFIILFIFGIVIYLFASLFQEVVRAECDKFEDYGYVTYLDTSISGNYKCYIKMEDGTKIMTQDLNIMDYKKPLTKKSIIITEELEDE